MISSDDWYTHPHNYTTTPSPCRHRVRDLHRHNRRNTSTLTPGAARHRLESINFLPKGKWLAGFINERDFYSPTIATSWEPRTVRTEHGSVCEAEVHRKRRKPEDFADTIFSPTKRGRTLLHTHQTSNFRKVTERRSAKMTERQQTRAFLSLFSLLSFGDARCTKMWCILQTFQIVPNHVFSVQSFKGRVEQWLSMMVKISEFRIQKI